MNADGTRKRNLTQTPYVDEMYPHVSPDGTKICFVLDRGEGRRKTRSVYYMNSDGTDRQLVERNARQPCWSPDGKTIAYLKGEYERYSTREYATAELTFYDLETGEHLQHVNQELRHLYAICWAPDPNWFLGVVHGALEFSDTILAFPAHGTEVYDLAKWGVKGCRPDFCFDGKRIVWGETDWELCIGDISFDGNEPVVTHVSKFAGCDRDSKVYHVDFSPDGKYVAFSYGPSRGGQQVGGMAKGWNICVSDLSGHWVQITAAGNHNKEPDWMPMVTETNSMPADERP